MPIHHSQSGGLLSEFFLTMLLTAALFAAFSHYLSGFTRKQYQLQQQTQLGNEVQQLLSQLGKAIRRSGYCASTRCTGQSVRILSGSCLLLSWDKRKVNALGSGLNAYNQGISFRWSDQQIETRNGVFTHCRGLGWETVTDPALAKVRLFRISTEGDAVIINISVENSTTSWHLNYWVNRKNNQ